MYTTKLLEKPTICIAYGRMQIDHKLFSRALVAACSTSF